MKILEPACHSVGIHVEPRKQRKKNQKSILRCCRDAHDKKHSTRTVRHYHQSSSAKHFGTHGAQ
jgi:hypothetical protein